MSPTNVNVDLGNDDLIRFSQQRQGANRWNGANNRALNRKKVDAIASAQRSAEADREANSDDSSAQKIERTKDEPAAYRRRGLLYVCIGFEEHPDSETYDYWLKKIQQRNFSRYQFIYVQLAPTPVGWQTTEYFRQVPKTTANLGGEQTAFSEYLYSNSFDQKQYQSYTAYISTSKNDGSWAPRATETSPGSGIYTCSNHGQASTLRVVPRASEGSYYAPLWTGRSEREVLVTTGPGVFISGVAGSACTFGTIPLSKSSGGRFGPYTSIGVTSAGRTVTNYLSLGGANYDSGPVTQTVVTRFVGETWTAKPLKPLSAGLANPPAQFRFTSFNYQTAKVGDLTKLLQGVAGGDLSMFKRIFIDAYPIYRDHQVAVDWFQGVTPPGTTPDAAITVYGPQLAPQMLKRRAINLFPHLNHLGSALKNGGHKLRTDCFTGILNKPSVSSSYRWHYEDHAFAFDHLAESEVTNATAAGNSAGFFKTWDSKDLYAANGFTAAQLVKSPPLRPLDPELPASAVPKPDGTPAVNGASTIVAPMTWHSQFMGDLVFNYFRTSKTTHLIQNPQRGTIGDTSYPSAYVNPARLPTDSPAQMLKKRYTHAQFNPLLRLYTLLDALDAYGIL